MISPDISSLFFTRDKVDQYYRELNIDRNAKKKYIDIGHPLHYSYRSPNQITTIKTENNHVFQNVLTYNSAQNYYQSEKVRIFMGPEAAEKVRLSENPYKDGYVPTEYFCNNIHKWKKYEYDVAVKCNWLKFNQNAKLAEELLRTCDQTIVARWDTDWADINARILMIIREDLRLRALNAIANYY